MVWCSVLFEIATAEGLFATALRLLHTCNWFLLKSSRFMSIIAILWKIPFISRTVQMMGFYSGDTKCVRHCDTTPEMFFLSFITLSNLKASEGRNLLTLELYTMFEGKKRKKGRFFSTLTALSFIVSTSHSQSIFCSHLTNCSLFPSLASVMFAHFLSVWLSLCQSLPVI